MAADKPVVYKGAPISTPYGTTNRIDFSSVLTLDHETEVPLLTLMNKLPDDPTDSYKFQFAVGRFAPRTDTLHGAVSGEVSGTDESYIVHNGSYFNEGDVVEVITTSTGVKVQLIVLAVSGNTPTCRAANPAAATPQCDDDSVIRVLYPAMREGSSGRNSLQTVPTVYENYVHIFEHYFDVTNLMNLQAQYTHPERVRLREESRKRHAVDQEYAYFFSEKIADTTTSVGGGASAYGGSAGKPRYQMDGLVTQADNVNTLTYGASLADSELFGFMTDVHNPAYSGGTKRLVLASGDLMEQVQLMANNAIRIATKDSTWGPAISEVQFGNGKVWQFLEAPVLSEARPGWGVVVHPAYMKRRTMQSTIYKMNVQNPIDNFTKDGFVTITSMCVLLPEIFGVIKPL